MRWARHLPSWRNIDGVSQEKGATPLVQSLRTASGYGPNHHSPTIRGTGRRINPEAGANT